MINILNNILWNNHSLQVSQFFFLNSYVLKFENSILKLMKNTNLKLCIFKCTYYFCEHVYIIKLNAFFYTL